MNQKLLKVLYKQDAKLAIEVAQVLGYKIRAKTNRAKLQQLLLSQLEDAAKTELGDQKLPPKNKLLEILNMSINARVENFLHSLSQNKDEKEERNHY